MNIVYILLPLALLLGFGFLITFVVMAAKGQFDDLETPAHKVLLEDVPSVTAVISEMKKG